MDTRFGGWSVYKGEHDSDPDHPVWRRFGLAHDKPCLRPDVLTCARSECQHANACQARGETA